ncbi:LacI family transcriptional regulator [Ectobacillus sp. JY-23]|uniref:LacI family DNA-binding transcriptional regulator n=1 Tax=Ectobacillus sp. JY-23 TaxID=2933872 RepID=UPI001FF3AC70|nr:LacI family DNA-binding transcriptional regulator [Ectobacillus sp. JY-23]UOY92073.1 LacI family transcriptional regulator [Ectobacillus sp. JY-23]
MSTIEDVAKLAGLSRTTVSRVINNHPYVSDDKKKRVAVAMHTLGFVPNSAARRLRKQRAETIAVLVPRVTNPFFSKLIESLEMAASEYKYKLIICQTRYLPEKELEYLQLLATKQVDGIILCSLQNKWEHVEPYLEHGPIVLCNEYAEEAKIPTVKFNQIEGAYEATKHLLEQGHRRLLFCSGSEQSMVVQHRKMGFLRAVAEHKLQVESVEFIENAYDIEDGRRVFHAISHMNKIPTAIFAGGDEVAAGIISEAKRNLWHVPEQLAVVGFDNQLLSEITEPAITTVCQPVDKMAYKVIEVIMDKIVTKRYRHKEIYEFDLELVVKGSTVKNMMMLA